MAQHNIGTLVESLNAKAEAAGCDVSAEQTLLSCTWGDEYGIRISGTDTARAVAYARAYFDKHLARLRDLNNQWHFIPHGENEISLIYYPCAD